MRQSRAEVNRLGRFAERHRGITDCIKGKRAPGAAIPFTSALVAAAADQCEATIALVLAKRSFLVINIATCGTVL